MVSKRNKIKDLMIKKAVDLHVERIDLYKKYDNNAYAVHFNHGMIEGLRLALIIVDEILLNKDKGEENGK